MFLIRLFMDIKNRLVILEELFEEIKAAEKVLDSGDKYGLSEEYKKGFRRGLFVALEKAKNLSIFAEVEEDDAVVYDLEKMVVPSKSIN